MNKLPKYEFQEILDQIYQYKFEAIMLFVAGILLIIVGIYLSIQIGINNAIPMFIVAAIPILASHRIWKAKNTIKKLLDKFEPF